MLSQMLIFEKETYPISMIKIIKKVFLIRASKTQKKLNLIIVAVDKKVMKVMISLVLNSVII